MTLLISIGVVLFIGAAYVLLRVFANTYRKLRGPRVVTCPETQSSAVVSFNAERAAAESLFRTPHLSVEQCSRWPERHACDQACLRGVDASEAAEHGLLIRPFAKPGEPTRAV
jgi:hypothetical protein